ncbi:MAG: alkaline phosphatase family protein [Actinomycetota bacterium]|nr:alkaline phosphatase family protein [Actinomycetota bacterium]
MGEPEPDPVIPDYGGACLSNLMPALLGRLEAPLPAWLPPGLAEARQVVLLVLDGLGWQQLRSRSLLAPVMNAAAVRPISSVAPTTTATALTSITTGLVPAVHGVMGYRVAVDSEVMNVLRWTTASGDARSSVPPAEFQPLAAFRGRPVSAVTKAEFASTGFTSAHLQGSHLRGWRVPSTLLVEVGRAVARGEQFVYAYYDGVDKVAHEFGLGEHYEAELSFADRLVERLAAGLPPGAALVVTADHGQVEVGPAVLEVDRDVLDGDVVLASGEGRFRWFHTRSGREGHLAGRLAEAYGHLAWVRTRDEMEAEGWFGGPLVGEVATRVGQVALVAHQPVAFSDPADTGEMSLVCRHGSLTSDEVLVPLCSIVV